MGRLKIKFAWAGAFLFVFLIIFLVIGGQTKADVNDFRIKNFDANYVLDSSFPGGKMEVKETIVVDFSDYNHGILRAVPKKYQDLDTHLKFTDIKRDGNDEPYTTYSQNDNLVAKIGDADKTITGQHVYEISYQLDRVVNFVDGQPELFWDINGNQWLQKFDKVTATVSVKDSRFKATTELICYAGILGSKADDCNKSAMTGKAIFETNRTLLAGETLTIGVPLDDMGFSPAELTTLEKLRQNALFNFFYFVWPTVLAGFVLIKRWFDYGKDYKGKEVIVPEYEQPKGLTPAEVGLMADYRVDSKDISATIIDLAVRGYLRIHEDSKSFLFIKSKKYSLELVKNDFKGLKKHESKLLNLLFGSSPSAGKIIKMSDLKKDRSLSLKIYNLKKDLKDSLVDEYKYIEKPKYRPSKLEFIIAVVIVVGLVLSHEAGHIANVFLVLIILVAVVAFMSRRSHAGVEVYEKIMGLKMYMDVAEKHRFKMMQSVDRPYAVPTKTPELFEKLLPYAVALGVEKSWAKQFDGILKEQPDWMTGNSVATFSSASMASSLAGVTSSFSSSFSSSSGASGGSAGGGGGGGGGGGW